MLRKSVLSAMILNMCHLFILSWDFNMTNQEFYVLNIYVVDLEFYFLFSETQIT